MRRMEIVVTGYAGADGSRKIFENGKCREKLLERYSESFLGMEWDSGKADGAGGTGQPAGKQPDCKQSGGGPPDCKQSDSGPSDGKQANGGQPGGKQAGGGQPDCKQADSKQPDVKQSAERKAFEDAFIQQKEQGNAEDGQNGGVLAALWRLLKKHKSGGSYALTAIPVRQQTIEICETFGLNPYRLDAPSCRVWLTGDAAGLKKLTAAAGVPFAVIGYTAEGVGIWRTDTEVPSSLRRPEDDELWKILRPSETEL